MWRREVSVGKTPNLPKMLNSSIPQDASKLKVFLFWFDLVAPTQLVAAIAGVWLPRISQAWALWAAQISNHFCLCLQHVWAEINSMGKHTDQNWSEEQWEPKWIKAKKTSFSISPARKLLVAKLRKSLVVHYICAVKGSQQKTTHAWHWKELGTSWIQRDFRLVDFEIPNHELLSPSGKQGCTFIFYKQHLQTNEFTSLFSLKLSEGINVSVPPLTG